MKIILIFVFLLNLNLFGDLTLSKLLDSEIKLEKKLLETDLSNLSFLYKNWKAKVNNVSELQGTMMNAIQGEGTNPQAFEDLLQQISVELALAQSYGSQIQMLNERIWARQKRIEIMEMEKSESKIREEEADPLSGEWQVQIMPQDLKGKFTLKLSGTLISGTYELSGGWKGSLKGTLVGNRIRLERIDAEQGYVAIYYGKVDLENFTLSGTWESTLFTTGGPMTGNWTGRKVREQ